MIQLIDHRLPLFVRTGTLALSRVVFVIFALEFAVDLEL